MLWVLVLHIIAVLFWAAGLLYLPLLLAASGTGNAELTERPNPDEPVARFIFTHVATPAALLAIVTGTGVFLIGGTVEFWLIAKLTVVTLLVVGHAATGFLVLRFEDTDAAPRRGGSWLLAGVLGLLMVGIISIVLAKPGVPQGLPWVL